MPRKAFLMIGLLLFMAGNGFVFGDSKTSTGSAFNPGAIIPEPLDFNNELLVNPGKGWILYGVEGFWKYGGTAFGSQNEQTWAAATIGYMRFGWNDIQPTDEDSYNWAPIDKAMAECKAHGKKFAFGVMNANSSTNEKYITPQWVFNAGAAFTDCTVSDTFDPGKTTIQRIPVWNDPVFIRKLKKFVNALAARYDGHPDIAFIDIRSYGNWGENHVRWGITGSKPLSAADFESLHLQAYLDAFKKTLLVTADSENDAGASYSPLFMDSKAFIWARDHGIAGRNDGIVFPRDTSGGPTGALKLQKYKDRLPAVLEFWGSYQTMRDKGYWSDNYLRQDVKFACASYCSLGYPGDDGPSFYNEKKALIVELGNRMGYYFQLQKAVFDGEGHLTLQWLNKGVAPIYIPAYLAVAFIDPANGKVVERQWLDEANPRSWAPGKTITENLKVNVGNKSDYKLAIGLFSDKEIDRPDIRLGIKGRDGSGWYVLSDMPREK